MNKYVILYDRLIGYLFILWDFVICGPEFSLVVLLQVLRPHEHLQHLHCCLDTCIQINSHEQWPYVTLYRAEPGGGFNKNKRQQHVDTPPPPRARAPRAPAHRVCQIMILICQRQSWHRTLLRTRLFITRSNILKCREAAVLFIKDL